MKVFAERYLEEMKYVSNPPVSEWAWEPADSRKIYASGANTSSRESTYADERDNRSDVDRPNEGSHGGMNIA
ncbi:MAG: hypothetical protein FWD98_09080 [Defluviitaleaceae bacterium]|nr:hypothetical protein [Defluviitaleaceae bacterium]